ncbi:hypothetical protein Salat_1423000 [Sesamum alatum]|uniref:Uncharacterized protein n=1 Tax=Sesamum alatum TaxID=300844 RepID=A0AAE2CLQ0_9LAMI|nr:hypothetical protein Salat_1423000 [Sesamum alatum]
MLSRFSIGYPRSLGVVCDVTIFDHGREGHEEQLTVQRYREGIHCFGCARGVCSAGTLGGVARLHHLKDITIPTDVGTTVDVDESNCLSREEDLSGQDDVSMSDVGAG